VSLGIDVQRKFAQRFRVGNPGGDICNIRLRINKYGSPTDNLKVSLYSDGTGEPGTLLDEADNMVSGSSLTTSAQVVNFSFTAGYTLGYTQYYWIVVERTGSISNSNYYEMSVSTTGTYYAGYLSYTNASDVWTAASSLYSLYFQDYFIV